MTKNTKILLLFSALALASASKSSFYNSLALSNNRTRRDVDPHSKDLHCVDVSTYEEVVWDKVPREKCTATFPEIRETKSKTLCEIVTTLQCNVIGWTDCKMDRVQIDYKGYKMTDEVFKPRTCKETEVIEMHTKKKPECKKVTKQNCVTKWVVKPSGQKVWDGNEDCEEVEWDECNLVDYQVPFIVPKITCSFGEEIPWMDCVEDTLTQSTCRMTCEPRSAVSCVPQTQEKCITVTWEEVRQEAKPECTQKTIPMPRQEVSHKKKCLLPDTATKLPDGPLQDLRPKQNLDQNVFPNPNGKRSARDFGPGGRPSPVFVPEQ